MPRKDHLPRQTRQEHITLQPNRSIEFRVTDDFGSFSPPHWHDALEIIYILEGSSIVTLSDRTKTVLPVSYTHLDVYKRQLQIHVFLLILAHSENFLFVVALKFQVQAVFASADHTFPLTVDRF